MEELFVKDILPRLGRDTTPEDIDELVSLLLEERRRRVQRGTRASAAAQPIDASLDTTGWLRENQLVARDKERERIAQQQKDLLLQQNLIGDGVGRPGSRATQHHQQPDRLATYDARAVMRARVTRISEILHSPPGTRTAQNISAPMGAAAQPTRAGNPEAFRMRDMQVYSKVCASIVQFH